MKKLRANEIIFIFSVLSFLTGFIFGVIYYGVTYENPVPFQVFADESLEVVQVDPGKYCPKLVENNGRR